MKSIFALHLEAVKTSPVMPETSTEKETQQNMDRSTPIIKSKYSCNSCNLVFLDMQEMRFHFKSDEHVETLQNKSEVSDSEEEEEEEPQLIQGPKITFQSENQEFSIYKSVASNITELNNLQKGSSLLLDYPNWTLIGLSGGHFACCIFKCGDFMKHSDTEIEPFLHTSSHRYTVRRKQGGSQSSHDNKGTKAKSAGSNLRRNNEKLLKQDVKSCLLNWKQHIEKSNLIFYYAPGEWNKRLIFDENSVINRNDERLRTMPISPSKCNTTELIKVFRAITIVKIKDCT